MIVLKAPNQAQQSSPEDCFYAQEGEILRVPVFSPPDHSTYSLLIGIQSGKGTAIFEVAEVGYEPADMKSLILTSYIESGWEIDIAQPKTEETLQLFEAIASKYPVGEILYGVGSPPVAGFHPGGCASITKDRSIAI